MFATFAMGITVRYLSYLFKSLTLLNIILLALAMYLASFTIFHLPVNVKFMVSSTKKLVEEKKTEVAQNLLVSPSDYTIIGEQNLFHPDRTIPVEKPAAPPLPVPEFVLFGTLITDEMKLAYLEDKKAPQDSPGRGKRQAALMTGQSLSGFTLQEVDPDKVIMVRGDEKISVLLNAPKVRETVAIAPVPAAGTAPGLPPPPAPQVRPAAQPPSPGAAISNALSRSALRRRSAPRAQNLGGD